MRPIGGYFELELRKGKPFHEKAICLNSGRNCFEYILRSRGYKSVYLPYYTCEVMFDVPRKLDIIVRCYSINSNFEPAALPELQPEEAFVYTNYFGLKQDCVERLAHHYGNKLIVDNSQAFYAPRFSGIDTFYSPRKFFGVPDGGYLYTDFFLDADFPQANSLPRMTHLLKRIESGPQSGYKDFRSAEESLDHAPMLAMSTITSALLNDIDYAEAAFRRKENYCTLAQSLNVDNLLDLDYDREIIPMVYPFLTQDSELRNRLIGEGVFIPQYWNLSETSHKEGYSWERSLADRLLPLPIDQRYESIDMYRIIDLIRNV